MDQKLIRQPNSYKKGFENPEILKFFDLDGELYGVNNNILICINDCINGFMIFER